MVSAPGESDSVGDAGLPAAPPENDSVGGAGLPGGKRLSWRPWLMPRGGEPPLEAAPTLALLALP